MGVRGGAEFKKKGTNKWTYASKKAGLKRKGKIELTSNRLRKKNFEAAGEPLGTGASGGGQKIGKVSRFDKGKAPTGRERE